MRPAIVMPLYDPDGSMYPHLERIAPLLKETFAAAYLSVDPGTANPFPERYRSLEQDDFYHLLRLETDLPVGDHFHALYDFAAAACPPEQVLHLCFLDRVAFALQTPFKPAFLADVAAVGAGDTPLVFERTPAAWQTHPQNYVEIEQFATRIGELLLGKPWDYGWCHLALTARQLKAALPGVKKSDLSMVAEILLLVQPLPRAKAVDWLAWEDPFLLGADPRRLQDERQRSPQETRKRLSYVVPILQILYEKSLNS
jgi:hypothetical protein